MALIELGLIVPDVCLVNFTPSTDSVFVRIFAVDVCYFTEYTNLGLFVQIERFVV